MNLSVGSESTVFVTCSDGRMAATALALDPRTASPSWPDSVERKGQVRAALLPCLAEARLMRSDEHRAATRAGPPLAGAPGHAARISIPMDPSRGTHYVAECPLDTLSWLRRLAHEAGMAIGSVTHADFAWASATADAAHSEGASICAVQVLDGAAHTRLLLVINEKPVALRRLPLDAERDRVTEALSALTEPRPRPEASYERTPLLLLGDLQFRQQLLGAARVAACSILEPAGVIADLEHDPAAVAAAFAGTGPRFVPPDVVVAAKRRTRRRSSLAGVGAVILLLGAGVLDTFALHEQIARARAARDSHAAQVTEALAARAHADMLAATLSQAEALRRDAPRWTALLAALSNRLPGDARVASLGARSDSLYLVLEGSDAASAFDGLLTIWWLSGSQVAAPVERDVDEEAQVTERLSAAASISWAELNGRGGGNP